MKTFLFGNDLYLTILRSPAHLSLGNIETCKQPQAERIASASQRRSQGPSKYLRWRALQQQLISKSRSLLLRSSSCLMFAGYQLCLLLSNCLFFKKNFVKIIFFYLLFDSFESICILSSFSFIFVNTLVSLFEIQLTCAFVYSLSL